VDERTDIEKTVDSLRKRADRLYKLADELAAEYGLATNNGATVATATKPAKLDAVGGVSRAEQLRKYLEEHGPMRRAELLERTGIPVGTLGMLLQRHCIRDDASKTWSWDPTKGEDE
jgi:hypothetical protein